MTAIDNTPTNKNFLNPLNFQFQLKRAPNLNFFIQKVNIPSVAIQLIDIPNVFNYIPDPGNKVQYGEFTVTFKVDEDLSNYREIHDWLRSLGFPESFAEYKALAANAEYTGTGIKSDISLIVLNALKRPNFEITFRDAFPVFLSEVMFDTTLADVQYVTATATFKYLLFDLHKL